VLAAHCLPPSQRSAAKSRTRATVGRARARWGRPVCSRFIWPRFDWKLASLGSELWNESWTTGARSWRGRRRGELGPDLDRRSSLAAGARVVRFARQKRPNTRWSRRRACWRPTNPSPTLLSVEQRNDRAGLETARRQPRFRRLLTLAGRQAATEATARRGTGPRGRRRRLRRGKGAGLRGAAATKRPAGGVVRVAGMASGRRETGPWDRFSIVLASHRITYL
jgi:hypothetical protein